MKASRLSEYRVMWVFVFFDLPTYTSLGGRSRHYDDHGQAVWDDGALLVSLHYEASCSVSSP